MSDPRRDLDSMAANLSADAVAVLEFTSNVGEAKRPLELTYILSKDSFIWAGFSALLAQQQKPFPTIDVDAADLHSKFYRIIAKEASTIYIGTPSVVGNTVLPAIVPSHAPGQPSHDLTLNSGEKNRYFQGMQVLKALLQEFYSDPLQYDAVANSINNSIVKGYTELYTNQLVTDPIIEAALAVAILSFVPFSFVKRTKDGRVVYRKIQASLWKYERSRKSGAVTQVDLTLKTARIAKVVKAALVSAWSEATKDEDDEPEE